MKIDATCKVQMTKAVEKAVAKSAPETLSQAGRYNMRVARALIKHRKNPDKSSAPGTPPHSHKGGGNPGFKRTIVYAVAPDKKSVVIGPKLVRAGLSNIARTHEFGGIQRIRDVDPELAAGIKIGDVAPVSEYHVTKRDNIQKRDPNIDPKTSRSVVWVRIRTKTQKAHSNRLYKRMIQKYATYRSAYYPARPYMRPSLKMSIPKLSKFWKNSIKK